MEYIKFQKNQSSSILSINNETMCSFTIFIIERFMTYAPSFILGKLFLEKTPGLTLIKSRFVIEIIGNINIV